MNKIYPSTRKIVLQISMSSRKMALGRVHTSRIATIIKKAYMYIYIYPSGNGWK